MINTISKFFAINGGVKKIMQLALIAAVAAASTVNAADAAQNSQSAKAAATVAAAPAAALVADSLIKSARPGFVPDDISDHLKRASVSTAIAVAIDPKNARAWLARADVLAARALFGEAAQCQKKALQLLGWQDHEGCLNWLRYSLADMSTSEQREQMLLSVAADKTLPAALRSEARVNMGALMEGRGDFDKALDNYTKALEIQPTQIEAINSVGRLREGVSLGDSAAASMAMLRGNPRAASVAWQLGILCGDVGLHGRAVKFFEYCQSIYTAADVMASDQFRRDYMTALIDAGEYKKALEQNTEAISGLLDISMAAQQLRAFAAVGDDDGYKKMLEQMRQRYEPTEASARRNSEMAVNLAWFNYYYRNSRAVAGNWADMAYTSTPDNDRIRRVWAMVHLDDDAMAEKVEEILTELSDSDIYAAAALIRLKHSAGADVSTMVAALDNFVRSGEGWRYAMSTLKQLDLPTPPARKAASEISAAADEFFAGAYAAMAADADSFISFTVKAPEKMPADKSLTVDLELVNISETPVTLGSWALVNPKVSLNIRMTIPRERLEREINLPLRLMAPAQLAAGQRILQRQRLDLGELDKLLGERPLSECVFSVQAVLDPVISSDGTLRSSLGDGGTSTVEFTRSSLLETDSSAAYEKLLVKLADQLRTKTTADAAKAAELTCSLLKLIDRVEDGQTLLAGKASANMQKPQVLAMLKYALTQTSEPVKLATLNSLDELISQDIVLSLAGPLLMDESPQVRIAAVKLISASQYGKKLDLVKSFMKSDPSQWVRTQAATLK